jgi:hypothetical protein
VTPPWRRLLWPRLAHGFVSPPLTEPPPVPPEEVVQALVGRIEATAQARLGRSLAIRQVDAGSCNGCELEINAMQSVVYDLERFGLRFVSSPRHADVLLVTGRGLRRRWRRLQGQLCDGGRDRGGAAGRPADPWLPTDADAAAAGDAGAAASAGGSVKNRAGRRSDRPDGCL